MIQGRGDPLVAICLFRTTDLTVWTCGVHSALTVETAVDLVDACAAIAASDARRLAAERHAALGSRPAGVALAERGATACQQHTRAVSAAQTWRTGCCVAQADQAGNAEAFAAWRRLTSSELTAAAKILRITLFTYKVDISNKKNTHFSS